MPPVSKAGGTAFRKDVAFVTKDADEQVASGIVMVPDKVDLQNDFAREETIREFVDQFETFEAAGQAGGGIMHAVWPDGWMELERNEVLDEAEEIGGEEVAAGAWVQDWAIENDQLWDLIDGGILEGYSIGAIQVDWDGPFEQDEVDVDTSEVPDEELVWELTDGIIREVSTVDIPAVPDAQILEAKALEKRLAEHIGNPDAFVEEAMDRGHTEAEAERLWDVLNEAMEADGAGDPGKQSVFARAGKAFLSALTGSDDGADDHSSPEAPDRGATKEGRTLSTANRESLFATVDASLDVLHDAGVDDLPKRFTEREDVDFDLDEHSARTWEGDHPDDEDGEDDEEEEEAEAASTTEHATGGDTPDDNSPMSDDTEGEDKSLAEQNAAQIKELTDTVADLADAVQDEEEKTVEIELGGEVVEVAESEAKAWFEDGDSEDPMAEAPPHVKALAEQVEEVTERIERMNRQSGTSDQIHGAAQNGAAEDDPLDDLAKLLS